MEYKLKDAFGHPYWEDLLSRGEIIERLEDLDIPKVVALAYGAYCPDLTTGVCEMDLRTGKLVNASYTQGSGDIQGMHYLLVYSVEQNLDLPSDDLFSEEDFKARDRLEEKTGEAISMTEFAEIEGIDMDERELEALIDYAYDVIHSPDSDWWSEITVALDAIYAHPVVEVER